MSAVIQIEDLSKYYRLGLIGGRTLREDVNRWMAALQGKPDPALALGDDGLSNRQDGEIWALKDVNLEIQEGEILGIIGRNGAGKSTLLKILSRITAPTTGRVKIRGRVGSLLEVGTGFHPELTGRENIFLNGAILGMTRREVKSKIEEIIDFSEIEQFIDTPVKRYSSGMALRLAFAVAAHLDPEILVVDEVLAVGDAEFQRKCLGKMKSVSSSGRTVLFVSHNMMVIKQLCDKILWLQDAGIKEVGSTDRVVNNYLGGDSNINYVWMPGENESGAFRYERVEVVSRSNASASGEVSAVDGFDIKLYFSIKNSGLVGRIAIKLVNMDGVTVLASADTDKDGGNTKRWETGKYCETCSVPGHLLSPGKYSLTISKPTGEGDEIIEDILLFVVSSDMSLTGIDGRPGVIAPMLDWVVRKEGGSNRC